jgi:exopolysaccharide biosynthesis predicted pyruvyltransferase EpsI
MLPVADRGHLGALRDQSRSRLREAIGPATDVALVDAPHQRNVGDSLILAGELAHLRTLRLRVRYLCDLWSYDAQALRKALPEGPVLLHGGGNLGDLWPGHQALRERVIRELGDRRVVQLPQSLHFQDAGRAAEAHRVLAGHPDLHLLLRDSLSMQKAADLFPGVRAEFCPDMALGWDAPSGGHVGEEVLVIARADHEAASDLGAVDGSWVAGVPTRRTDWTEWNAGPVRRVRWEALKALDRIGVRSLVRLNEANIANAVTLYGAARVVVSDRLHAHVLAAMLGVPHVVLDNSYRKVSTIFGDYTGGFSTAHYATSVGEARELATALVRR